MNAKVMIIVGFGAVIIISIILVIALALQSPSEENSNPAQSSETVAEADDTEEIEEAEKSEATEATETEPETETDEQVVSTVNVFFNGTMVKTHSKEEAMASEGINLSDFSDSREVGVQAVIGYGQEVSRVRVWTENGSGGSNGDEYFLYSDSDWSATLDLSDYSGTILVVIAVSDNSVPPHTEHSYFKVILPDDSEEGNETESQNVQETTVGEETENGSNPQMFINGIAVDGYQTFDDATANPIVVATKELQFSANNVESITRISVQFGSENGQTVEIWCNPLNESNEWKQTVDASSYEGNILVMYIDSTVGFGSNSTGQFVAVQFQE